MTTDTVTPNRPEAEIRATHSDTDIVLLDDSQIFADAFQFRFFRKKVCHFEDPRQFVAQHHNFSKNTVICIDYDFGLTVPVTGIEIAAQLHALGFTRLYLVSGTYFDEADLPGYLTFIEKINLKFFNVM